jgi:hypothetical protein
MYLHYICSPYWEPSSDKYGRYVNWKTPPTTSACGWVGAGMRYAQYLESMAVDVWGSRKYRILKPDLDQKRYFDVITRHAYETKSGLDDFAACFMKVMIDNTKNSYCSVSGNNFVGHWKPTNRFDDDTNEGSWMLRDITEADYLKKLEDATCDGMPLHEKFTQGVNSVVMNKPDRPGGVGLNWLGQGVV